MNVRLEVDIAYGCRPKKGERRLKDGRLVKCSIYFGSTLAECIKEARTARKGSEKVAPGYTEVIDVKAYDAAEFRANPMKAKPFHVSTSI